eukprot:5281822-Heterocapsa_arctica.AAC.1
MFKPKVSVDIRRSLRVAAVAGGWAWEVSRMTVGEACAANFAVLAAGSGEKALSLYWWSRNRDGTLNRTLANLVVRTVQLRMLL